VYAIDGRESSSFDHRAEFGPFAHRLLGSVRLRRADSPREQDENRGCDEESE